MTRLRKAARLWDSSQADILARRVTIAHEGPDLSIEPARLFQRAAPIEVSSARARVTS
jgi:hypothetical protein